MASRVPQGGGGSALLETQLCPPQLVLLPPAPAVMTETAKRLRTDGEPDATPTAPASASTAARGAPYAGSVGAAGARLPAEPAGSSASMPAELRAKIVHALYLLI